ncbi:MAG TPA: pilus assembly protein PilM [Gammaproteobacteria bacterium]|nr:pilus assembly protein PilM [Gammaproteobacteria bacterium]
MLFLSRQPMNRALLGIDINSNAICITALTRNRQGFSIQTYARAPLPIDEPNPEQIISILQQTLTNANTRIKSAAIAIDHSAALFKVIEVDASLTEAEILSHLKSHISQIFNQSAEELLLDFERLGPSKNDPNLVTIRWIAAKKQPVINHIANLKKIGLTTVAVDINSYALQRAAYYCLGKSTVTTAATIATLYINGESILFTVSDHQTPIYTLTEHNKSLTQKDTGKNCILAFITRALQLYYHSESHKPIDLLALCGHIPDISLMAAIQQETHIPSKVVDPFEYLSYKSAEKTSYPACEFMLSIGLAMPTARSL